VTGQQVLFDVPVDERQLADAERTILEAIDKLGSITAHGAGRIVYRMRGWERLLTVPRAWITSSGARVLERLEREGAISARRGGRWARP